jgi:hypothetical protein
MYAFKLFHAFLFLSASWCECTFAQAEDPQPTIPYLAAALESNFSRESLSAQIEVNLYQRPDDITKDKPKLLQTMRWIRKGKQQFLQLNFVDKNIADETMRETYTWDGSVGKSWLEFPGLSNDRNSGRISAQPHPNVVDAVASRYFATVGRHDFADILKLPKATVQSETLNGEMVYYVSVYGQGDTQGTFFQLWLSPKHGLLPTRWRTDVFTRSNPSKMIMLNEFDVTDFGLAGGTVFFPKKLYKKNYDGTVELVTIDLVVGADIKDSQFDIEWPKGTAIWDETLGKGYRIK